MEKREIVIEPVTRLEGEGRIEIYLDESGNVKDATFSATTFRGFEKFCQQKMVEILPLIVTRICGICPTPHHLCSSKAVDKIFNIKPSERAVNIRRVLSYLYMIEDHLIHIFALALPDFLGKLVPENEIDKRCILKLKQPKLVDFVKVVVKIRSSIREIMHKMSGNKPVLCIPGGVVKDIFENKEIVEKTIKNVKDAVGLYKETFQLLLQLIPENIYRDEKYAFPSTYMGLVSGNNGLEFYDGKLKIVDENGKEVAIFNEEDYLKFIREEVVTNNYSKFSFVEGEGRRMYYKVGPLARINVADKLQTPEAREMEKEVIKLFGKKPIHNLFAYHFARVIEGIFSGEKVIEDLQNWKVDGGLKGRKEEETYEKTGIAAVEAARGTLIHHYVVDSNAKVEKVNIITPTAQNMYWINQAVRSISEKMIKSGEVKPEILNHIESIYRVFDPCLSCAVHAHEDFSLPLYVVWKDKIQKVYYKSLAQ